MLRCDSGITDGIPAGDIVTQILYETQETTSIAAYAQADWTFAKDWTLTAGLRWTEETKDFIAGQAYLSNVERQRERNFPDFADLSNKWTELDPKLGLTYNLAEDAILYATYSEGFHSGGFFGVNQNTSDFIENQYDPENSQSYEMGLKSDFWEGRFRFNLAMFRNDFKDKQESSVQVDPRTRTVSTKFDNVADARYQGIEIESHFAILRNFIIFGNYGYLDAKYQNFVTDINAADGETILEDASFLTPRNAPEYTYGIGTNISYPFKQGELDLWIKYAVVSPVETDLLNVAQGRIASSKDLSGSFGYLGETFSVQLFGRNLTNERYEAFTPIAALFATGTVNRGRSYGLEFVYDF